MNTAELDLNLARFYVEARTKKGEEYSRSALLGFRNSVERYLNNNGRTVKISRNQVFQKSNKILDAKLRINRRAGKENVQHKPVIVPSDLAKIRASPFLSVTNPAGLLRRTWFYVSLYWCRRGREGQRDLRRDSSKFTKDANGREYTVMTHEEATLKPSWWWNQQALSWTRNKALQHWSRRWCICQSQIVRVQVESLLPSVLSKTKSQIHHRRHRVVWKQPTWREQAGRHDEDHIQRSESLSSVHQSFRPGFSNNRAFRCECTRPPYNVRLRA